MRYVAIVRNPIILPTPRTAAKRAQRIAARDAGTLAQCDRDALATWAGQSRNVRTSGVDRIGRI